MDFHIAPLEESPRTRDQPLILLMSLLRDFRNVLVNCCTTVRRVKHVVTKQLPTQARVLSSSSSYVPFGLFPLLSPGISSGKSDATLQGHAPITLQGCVCIIMSHLLRQAPLVVLVALCPLSVIIAQAGFKLMILLLHFLGAGIRAVHSRVGFHCIF